MGAVAGLVVGTGLLLVWRSFASPRARRPGRPGPANGIEQLLLSAGAGSVSPVGLVSLCSAAGAVTFAAMLAISGTWPVAATFGCLAAYLPVAVLRGRARRRRRELAEVWPEAVDNLASAVRAGLSLPEALAQLGDRGPEPLRANFADFGRDYLATGGFGDCLDRLKRSLSDPVGDRVVEALRVAREVGGGDLGRLLRSLSAFLRDDVRARAELESRQAWVVNGARLAAAAPWVVLLVLSFQPAVIGRYRSGTGVAVLVIGAITCLAAYRLMLRIGRLPEERRVLQ